MGKRTVPEVNLSDEVKQSLEVYGMDEIGVTPSILANILIKEGLYRLKQAGIVLKSNYHRKTEG